LTAQTETKRGGRLKLLALIPLVAFLLLAGVFLAQLLSGRDSATIPSALIGAPAPATALPAIDGLGLPGVESAAFAGKVTVVNVWASWCAPCRIEHPQLMELSRDQRIRLVGINYKDTAEQARGFLADLGNPFAAAGSDPAGRTAIDWGVYGVPETFLVGKDGRIAFKHVGPIDATSMREEVMPAIEAALAASE